jgi:hypothetical protein
MFEKFDIIVEKPDEFGGEIIGVVTAVSNDWITIHWLRGFTGKAAGTWGCPREEAESALKNNEWTLRKGGGLN